MTDSLSAPAAQPAARFSRATARLVPAGGPACEGTGCGAATAGVGQGCFNAATTGYPRIGLDLAKDVSCRQMYSWRELPWAWNEGYPTEAEPSWRAVVLDYGCKRNILRQLAAHGADITVLPCNATYDDVMRHSPHGVLLSNGPGDPEATGAYAIPTIRGLVESNVPVFGICL